MGPYSKQRQLERAQAVARLLSNLNLNKWARNYWSNVAANLSKSEEQYNSRVVGIYKEIRNQHTREWI